MELRWLNEYDATRVFVDVCGESVHTSESRRNTPKMVPDSDCASQNPSHTIGFVTLTTKEETLVALTCPSCGNDQKFLVKTLQMHIVSLEDGRVDVSEEGRPNVLELLCDECETALNIDEVDEGVRKELLLTLGAR